MNLFPLELIVLFLLLRLPHLKGADFNQKISEPSDEIRLDEEVIPDNFETLMARDDEYANPFSLNHLHTEELEAFIEHVFNPKNVISEEITELPEEEGAEVQGENELIRSAFLGSYDHCRHSEAEGRPRTDSICSCVSRSKFNSVCEGDEELSGSLLKNFLATKIADGIIEESEKESGENDSSIFGTFVVSETCSVVSNFDYDFPKDCFDGRQIENVGMRWIELVFVPSLSKGEPLLYNSIEKILDYAKAQFMNENTVSDVSIEEDGILHVIGDIHGQFTDMIRIFEQNGYPSFYNKFIFNGDLVDRGPDSVECVLTLFLMKIACPSSIFITRGNHESLTCGLGSFLTESFNKMSTILEAERFFNECHNVFNYLPLGYVINETYFVCHGGLPDHFDVSIFRNTDKPNFNPVQLGLMMSLLWNDPFDGFGMRPSKRGGSALEFGLDVTLGFLKRHDFNLLIRSHEYASQGFFYSHDRRCLTVFSAPNYCGGNGVGVVMRIKDDLSYRILPIRTDGIMNLRHNEFLASGHEEEMPCSLNPSSPKRPSRNESFGRIIIFAAIPVDEAEGTSLHDRGSDDHDYDSDDHDHDSDEFSFAFLTSPLASAPPEVEGVIEDDENVASQES